MNAVIFIHGKGGSVAESEHFKPLFPDCEVRDIVDNINAAIDWAVSEGMHVVYIKHNNITAGTRTFKPCKSEEVGLGLTWVYMEK